MEFYLELAVDGGEDHGVNQAADETEGLLAGIGMADMFGAGMYVR